MKWRACLRGCRLDGKWGQERTWLSGGPQAPQQSPAHAPACPRPESGPPLHPGLGWDPGIMFSPLLSCWVPPSLAASHSHCCLSWPCGSALNAWDSKVELARKNPWPPPHASRRPQLSLLAHHLPVLICASSPTVACLVGLTSSWTLQLQGGLENIILFPFPASEVQEDT